LHVDWNSSDVDAKRVVGFVLLGSALWIVACVGYVLTNTDDESWEVPTWWRGRSYAGVIKSIEQDAATHQPLFVEITLPGGEVRSFRCDAATHFVLWGDRKISPGTNVRVRYREVRSERGPAFLKAVAVMVLHEGMPGASGATGPTGVSGGTGGSGPVGASGATGASGLKAMTGATGASGALKRH
jgi:hypothetical protein